MREIFNLEELYFQRRKALLERMQEGVAVFLSASYHVRSNDTEFPYRQESNFYYLCGFEEDEAALVVKKESASTTTVLFVKESDAKQALWVGKRLGIKGAKKRFLVDAVKNIKNFEEELSGMLGNTSLIYFDLRSDFFKQMQHMFTLLDANREVKIKPLTFKDAPSFVNEMRLIKSSEEVALIKKSISIADEAHRTLMRIVQAGMKEYELHASVLQSFKKYNAVEAYGTIAAGGNNANVLHYIANSDTLKEGDLVLVDAGCEYKMYCSDITRTFPVSGRFSEAQKELYTLVLSVQKKVIKKIKPGVTKKMLQEISEKELCKGMVNLGILKGDVNTLLDEKAYKKYYPHGIGHWLGIDVHDTCPYYDDEGNDIAFQSGMVMTIEPGLYIRNSERTVPKKYRGIGIRIEDNVLVTEEGCANLSAAIPKEISEIELLMATEIH